MHMRPTNDGQLDEGAHSISLPILSEAPESTSSPREGGCGCASTPAASESPSKIFWRSLDDKNGTDEFQRWRHNEFQEGAATATDDERRTFMKLMGASAALAGLAATGCRRLPEQHILPYAQRPDNRVPGTPVKYATAYELGGIGYGVLATSVDGRPIKLDGNPNHPTLRGSSDSITQARVLELYDTHRSRTLNDGGKASSMDAFRTWLATMPSDGLAVLAEPSSSPTLADMRGRLAKKFPSMKWFEWAPINDDAERAGTEIAFGKPMRAIWDLSKATGVVLSLDADFLLSHHGAVKNAREFAATRRIENPDPKQQTMSCLYVVESALTVTGMNADERVPVRSADVAAFAAMVAKQLGQNVPAAVASAVASLAGTLTLSETDTTILGKLVEGLQGARGRSLVIAGENQPAAVHALAAVLNEALGNVGSTVQYVPAGEKGRTCLGDIKALAEAIGAGQVKTLAIIGGNPIYDAPSDLRFGELLAKAGTVVHLSFYRNETTNHAACRWHIPQGHFLETWGDVRAADGTISAQQPLIAPLLADGQGGLSAIEFCAELLGEDPRDGMTIVRRTWQAVTKLEGPAFEAAWRAALNDGVVSGSAYPLEKPAAQAAAVATAVQSLPATTGGSRLEVTFARDAKVYDGRFANITWLQELPDPVSKLTWDNAAYMSPASASALGVNKGDLISVTVGGASLQVAAWPMPGMAADSVRLHLGYGRTADGGGPIAADAGFNSYALRSSGAMSIATGASISKAGGSYPLAHTQDHGATDALIPSVPAAGAAERLPALIREDDLGTYKNEPDFAKHRAHVAHRLSLWEETALDGAKFRWAMAIDLSTCTGCSACVTACQAENNIPVVGKEQVMRGREMHWMRIDRYFKGSDANRPIGIAIQPVTCMHCENAPCEQVCPVAATTHDRDGLNVMVYNRCIGTRYCSNNCPYKVRRFNFFDWHRKDPVRDAGFMMVQPDYYTRDGADPWTAMQFNPQVTVRMRGVMEKCTFCVQRIQQAKITTKNAWTRSGGAAASSDWSIADGSFTTACAEACPSQAITFGDLNNPESKVAKLHASSRSYGLLEELNSKPRVQYLAKVRNPTVTFDHAGHDHGHGDGHDHDHDHDHKHDEGDGHASLGLASGKEVRA
jgi:MoCo/4Fe-4S cofactor protein with predicted Tat translocation signal